MTSTRIPGVPFVEIELKLALPCGNPQSLEPLLASLPLLARRKATRERLYNTYFDSPDNTLNRQRTALRIRRVDGKDQPVWLQTLKMGGSGDSALSQRGEWEAEVPNASLDFGMLAATPWPELDPQGTLGRSLIACFTTDFTRTRWTINNRDNGSVIEVALDLGQIVAGDLSAPICELELELKAGQPNALFAVASQIADVIAVLPLSASKAQRGFALGQGFLEQPARAKPPVLTTEMPVPEAAGRVLRETFSHFCTNLHTLLVSDDPEVVHQARVAWRRLKTALTVFKNTALAQALPSLQALKPLLRELGALRDLEVANLQTLPMLAHAFVGGSPKRKARWHSLQEALTQEAHTQLQRVRKTLVSPTTGAALLTLTEWLENHGASGQLPTASDTRVKTLQPWARLRMERLREQLKRALKKPHKPDNQHRARILAKRLRYGVETLRPVLPKRRAQQWHRQATRLQNTMGAARDLQHALDLAKRLKAHATLLAFLNAVALGRSHPR